MTWHIAFIRRDPGDRWLFVCRSPDWWTARRRVAELCYQLGEVEWRMEIGQ